MRRRKDEATRRVGRRAFLAGIGAAAGGAAVANRATGSAIAKPTDFEQQQVPLVGSHRILWSVDTDRPLVALTFDDGPDPNYTPAVLRMLSEHGARATFMMMGHNAVASPALARAVAAAGHEIGNHTSTHRNLAYEPADVAQSEIETGAAEIARVTGVTTRWFRPPRGQLSAWTVRYAAVFDHDTVMWSRTRGPEGDARSVRAHLREMAPGDIVLLHDGLGRGTFRPDGDFTTQLRRRRIAEIEALPDVLADARARDLELVTLSELVAAERAGTQERPISP